jgi:sugar O-acyltransferase (sialic acid O-acetyltransferase NeuD family)
MTTLIGVYGASGCGRGVMPLLRIQYGQQAKLVFVDDNPPSTQLNGHECYTYNQFLNHSATRKMISLAIANPVIREKLALQCESNGIQFVEARASNTIQMDQVEIGEGAILCPFVTLTSNIRIGKHFHANLYSYVEHDCIIGNYVTFAPSVHCNGNVIIEDYAYIGTGALIKQGVPGRPLVIGQGAVVGMGAVVTKSIPAGAVVMGNPARQKVMTC